MKRISLLFLSALLVCAAPAHADPVNEGYAKLIESYQTVYGDSTCYAFYDIDHNNVEELILSYGDNNADWKNTVFTRIGSDTFECGSFGSMVALYAPKDGDGLLAVRGKMGYESVFYLSLKEDGLENSLQVSTLFEREVPPDEDYFSTDTLIEWLQDEITDLTYADQEPADWEDVPADYTEYPDQEPEGWTSDEEPEFPRDWYKTHRSFILEGTAHTVEFDYNDGGYFHLVMDGVNKYTFKDWEYDVLPGGGGIVYHATTDYNATITLIPGSEYQVTLSGTGYDGVCWEQD